jgi:hemerythrin-like domain-containing protein
MLRDKSLIPLSRQHHGVLALCVKIERSLSGKPVQGQPPVNIADSTLQALQQEAKNLFQEEVLTHFQAEEQVIFPVARSLPGLVPLVDELLLEHDQLRSNPVLVSESVTAAGAAAGLLDFAFRLSLHVRKEEQHLFQGMQEKLSREALDGMGRALEAYFQEAGLHGPACNIRS